MGKLKYKEGDKLGSYDTKLIKRLEKGKAVFECSFCHKEFICDISNIVRDHTKSCGCATKLLKSENHMKYHSGDRVGPKKIKLIKRLENKGKGSYTGIFECPDCGKEFIRDFTSIITGNTQSCGCSTYTKQQSYKEGSRVGPYNLLLIKRKGRNAIFQCNCGKEFTAQISNIVNGTTRSCGCISISRGEEKIKSILEKEDILFISQKSFKNCINPMTQRHLYFDFYLPEYNCCIEYDGEQHFKASGRLWNTQENLEATQYRDEIKNQYCKDNNIKLIRVPYTDFDKLDKDYLLERIFE